MQRIAPQVEMNAVPQRSAVLVVGAETEIRVLQLTAREIQQCTNLHEGTYLDYCG